jgi:predicted Holliday junction resolvase-like endonuclease
MEGATPPEAVVREQGATVTTEQIIWTVVIVVAVLALIAFIVSAMRKKSQHTKETRAAELRQEAQQRAAVIPDAQVRAKESEAEAERKRLEAEQAAERAQAARTEVVQHEATVEEQVREADRLDPNVDHKSRDYTPDTSSVIGTHAADSTTTRTTPVTDGYDERSDPRDPDTIFDSRDPATTTSTETTTTDTTTGATTTGTTPTGTHAAPTVDPDEHDGTTGGTGGSHRA